MNRAISTISVAPMVGRKHSAMLSSCSTTVIVLLCSALTVDLNQYVIVTKEAGGRAANRTFAGHPQSKREK